MSSPRMKSFIAVCSLACAFILSTPALVSVVSAQEATPVRAEAETRQVLLFAAPGMNAALLEQ